MQDGKNFKGSNFIKKWRADKIDELKPREKEVDTIFMKRKKNKTVKTIFDRRKERR